MAKKKCVIRKHSTYVYRVPKGKCKRPRRVKPRQSLTLDEIMIRYQRGLPIDQKVHEKVFVPHNDSVDFESLTKLDFDDRATLVAEKKAFVSGYQESIKEASESIERAQRDAIGDKEREERLSERSEHGSGDLDNTLPDDSRASDRGLSNKKSKPNRK